MERWREENREQNALMRGQLMEQMQQFVKMFAYQQPVRLSTKFSPRDRTELIPAGGSDGTSASWNVRI